MAEITEAQEAYFDHIAPGALDTGHFAFLEEKDAGETVITCLGEEIGHIVLDGMRFCEVSVGEDPDTGANYVSIINIGVEKKNQEVEVLPNFPFPFG